MTAVFNAPESGDSSVAHEARTSDAPQFDLKTLYSDSGATTGGVRSGNRETGNQIDFGIDDNLYARANDRQGGEQGGFGIERQSAMDIARRFASFDDDTNDSSNNNTINLDREDVGRLVEVYGDMFNAQNSLQEGDKSEAEDWLGEMRRDLVSFTRGLFGDSNEGSDEKHGQEQGGEEHTDSPCPEESASEGEGGRDEGNEQGGEEGSEEGSEESCEHGDSHVGSGTEGYTPEDSLVLLMNDMQKLTEALASGDTEAVQQIMSLMNRHLALLMRQLNGQDGNESEGEGGEQVPYRNLIADGERPDLFNPLNPINGLPNPGDILGGLPQPANPGDLLRNLPSPGDLFDIF